LGDGPLAGAAGIAADEVLAAQLGVVAVVGEQVPGDHQDRVADRDGCLPACRCAGPAASAAPTGRCRGFGLRPRRTRSAPHQASGCLGGLERRLQPVRLLPGQHLAQEARCAAVGNTVMSTPISAMIVSAAASPPRWWCPAGPWPGERGRSPPRRGGRVPRRRPPSAPGAPAPGGNRRALWSPNRPAAPGATGAASCAAGHGPARPEAPSTSAATGSSLRLLLLLEPAAWRVEAQLGGGRGWAGSERGLSVTPQGVTPVTRSHPVYGHRTGCERDFNQRSRWLSLVVGLAGLEPATSS
jgi:hypothetical protein